MIPAPFDYVRAQSVEQALDALIQHGDEAKLLAGGHSLLPLMKLRLAVPTVLVDIGHLSDLSYVRVESDQVLITPRRERELHNPVAAERQARAVDDIRDRHLLAAGVDRKEARNRQWRWWRLRNMNCRRWARVLAQRCPSDDGPP